MGLRERLGTWLARGTAWYVPDVIARLPHDLERPTEAATATEPKPIALTFDDGPTDRGTPELLEVLSAWNVRATFFLVGAAAQKYPQRVREIQQAGHLIGNHSQTHPDGWRTPEEELLADYDRSTEVLENLLQQPLTLMRPPYGKVTKPLVRWARARNQRIVLWDVMPGDFQQRMTAERIAYRVENHVQPGSVVCLHDNAVSRNMTPEALRQAIPKLLETGWQFAPLPQADRSRQAA